MTLETSDRIRSNCSRKSATVKLSSTTVIAASLLRSSARDVDCHDDRNGHQDDEPDCRNADQDDRDLLRSGRQADSFRSDELIVPYHVLVGAIFGHCLKVLEV